MLNPHCNKMTGGAPLLQHRYLLPGGLTLAAWQSAPKAQPDALCLHGWLDNANSFAPLAQQLPSYSLLALDLPGHGWSSHRSPDASYHFLDYVHEVAGLLRQQQWGPVTLIGHSMGGMIASVLAAVHPELVKQLILIDAIGLVVGDASQVVQQLRSASQSRWQSERKQKPLYPDLAAAAKARLQQGDLDLTSAVLLAERGTERLADGYRWRSDLRLRESSMYRLLPEQADQLLRAIECPVVALMAKEGMALMQQARQRFAPCYARLEVIDVAGGHHCHMTEVAVLAEQIEQFLLVS
ncbi:alpha/beta hydrolase [Rheinheimera sp.]|uniref:alpha/beta fold hydrolase n=1 Tax=Rheinheimera sp. TaxID=1869214 RepID=UPI00307E5800